jgi:hypothetical protein
MFSVVKMFAAVVSALLTYLVVGASGLLALAAAWPGYAVALPTRTFSLGMLVSRLGVALVAAMAAGAVAGSIQGVRSAWAAGIAVFAVAGYAHLALVWAMYPAWYHAAYLLPLVPAVVAAAAVMRPRAR